MPYVLGRLVTAGSSTWSQPADLEIIIDGSGPICENEAIHPGRRVSVGSEIVFSATVTDSLNGEEMSGVANVEVAFDEQGTGELSEMKFTPAKLKSEAHWEATLSVPELPLGSHEIWIRATDRVGNETTEEHTIEVIEKQPEENGESTGNGKPKKVVGNRVTGRIRYGTHLVKDGDGDSAKGWTGS